jgi:tetratricopeptide (TPR) repeat protein
MPILAPFEAFARDATALNVDEDESRLPIRWLAAAQVATRLADARPSERKSLLKVWTKQQDAEGEDGVWSALSVPGIHVHDMATAAVSLCALGTEMEDGGALNLAYSTVTHMRIALMDRGPAGARALCTLQQARVLRRMGLLEEAQDTYEATIEDAVRGNAREIEGRALLGLAIVAGQRGNYPEVLKLGNRALEILPPNSPHVGDAHNDLMVAASVTRDFEAAFDHGWRAYDASADASRRAGMIVNLSMLALRTGRTRAARRGFIAAMGLTQVERVQLSALGGLALASASSHDANELSRINGIVERRATTSTLPYELARTSFELAQAWQETGDLNKAEKCLARGRELAAKHGFHEVSFRSDILAEAIGAAKTAPPVTGERVERAIARFEELAVDEGVLALA